MSLTCSVIVPVYNSEATLTELVAEMGRVLPALAPAFEAVLVNDGSGDRSWEVISDLARQHPARVRQLTALLEQVRVRGRSR